MKNRTIILAAALLGLALAGCSSKNPGGAGSTNETLTPDQAKAKSSLEAQMQDAAATAKTYHAMDTPGLLSKLMEQSKAQREPFNSLAYRELKTRTDVDSKALVALIGQNRDAGGLLPLLLLRKLDNKSYLGVSVEERAAILTAALKSSKYFNTWGIPNYYLEDASNALIETGRASVPALKAMLDDTRLAPVFGSQEAMISEQLKYRVCDYALYFLKRIEGSNDFRLPVASVERDQLLKQALSAK